MKCPNIHPFGTAPNGEPVYLIQLDRDALSCQIITYGGAIRSLLVPDRNGNPVDVVLGYDMLEEYVHGGAFFGATVGRFANRIAKGTFQLSGERCTLIKNDGNNHLHGGSQGFCDRAWRIVNVKPHSATLALHSPDGEEGYPGNLECTVEFALEPAALVIRYRAKSDRDTICSLTNHSYFNLAGHDSGAIFEQEVQLFASAYTPSNRENIPLGTIAPVEGTPMDLRTPTRIGTNIKTPFRQLCQARGYDHNYVIDGDIGTLRPSAKVRSPETGISMQVETTLPGVQFYTANNLPRGHKGKNGCTYAPYHGFCLETQFFPDSPNQPTFPSPILKVGEVYCHDTVFRFFG